MASNCVLIEGGRNITMTKEVKMIPDLGIYEGLYFADTDGNIYRYYCGIKKYRQLKGFDNGRGYKQVKLSSKGIVKNFYIHVLIAKTFLEDTYTNPDNSVIIGIRQINHKDEDKSNNSASNLEYCDCKYNNTYGTKIERMLATKKMNKKRTA